MKILFHIDNLSFGGAERVVAILANTLAKKHEVIIASSSDQEKAYDLDSSIAERTITNTILKKYSNVISRNIERICRFISLVRNERPDVVIAFLPGPSIRATIAHMFFRKIPLIISVRNDPNKEYTSQLGRFIVKRLYNTVNGVVFQTEEAKLFFSDSLQKKSTIISNPIDLAFFDAHNEPFGQKIVTVGRLEEQKNHKLLIDAFILLKKTIPGATLHIYGTGSLQDELNRQIISNGLESSVTLAGNTKDVSNAIIDASLFVLSSDFEGMPNSLAEAMIMGIPCVSTDCPCGGSAVLIDNNRNGLLVNVGDVNLLCNAMVKILTNKKFAKKISMNAKRSLQTMHPDKISEKWSDYIEKVCHKK